MHNYDPASTSTVNRTYFVAQQHSRRVTEEASTIQNLVIEWLRINPDIYTFLVHRETHETVGYIIAIPVNKALYESIRNGHLSDAEMPASGIVPYWREREIGIYVMSIAIRRRYRLLLEGLFHIAYIQLLACFLDKLCIYAKHGVRATHFLAVAWTSEGHRICQYLGMKPVGTDNEEIGLYPPSAI